LQDIQATLDDKRAGRASKTVDAQQNTETGGVAQTTVTADVGNGQQRTDAAGVAAPKLSSKPQPAANSACMAKADLSDFVNAQSNAVADVLALNPGQKEERGRAAYKWPTRTLGSQVGPSLTKLTSHEYSFGVGQMACSTTYRLSSKK